MTGYVKYMECILSNKCEHQPLQIDTQWKNIRMGVEETIVTKLGKVQTTYKTELLDESCNEGVRLKLEIKGEKHKVLYQEKRKNECNKI